MEETRPSPQWGMSSKPRSVTGGRNVDPHPAVMQSPDEVTAKAIAFVIWNWELQGDLNPEAL